MIQGPSCWLCKSTHWVWDCKIYVERKIYMKQTWSISQILNKELPCCKVTNASLLLVIKIFK